MTFLHQRVQQWLLAQSFVLYHKKLLISFSGGKDSLCLLKLLLDLSMVYAWDLSILYVEHTWRLDSVYNCDHIISVAQKYNIKIYIYQIQGTTLNEQEARLMRYRVLLSCANYLEYSYIVIGHSQSDHIETMLNNLMRGMTIDGFYSLPSTRQINRTTILLRPLLEIKTPELLWFCRYYALPLWFDLSNVYNLYQRNRIRNELIPYLKQFFQRDIETSILELTSSSELDQEYIKQNMFKLYYRILHKNYIALNYTVLCRQHTALQLRVLYLFLRHNLGVLIPMQTLLNLHQSLLSPKHKKSKVLYLKHYFYYVGQWICIC